VSRELVFTSAPRGVKPGSQGFCTVAHTQGMPANLIQQLESLSGYRHVFAPQEPQASLNPVVSSHLTLAVAGRRCHVLSRISDAGLDYTRRTNKFAHHVVLDPAETPLAGPGWLLMQPGFMRKRWTGEPAVVPTGPVVPSGESKPRVCRAWQKLTGDAGWAGVLAGTAAAHVNRRAIVLFEPGMDTLPLVAESLALLPEELRWQITFCTYFTKLPAGFDCQWRCVADGTEEAVAARRAPQGAVVVDLCRFLGRAAGGVYVETARTGQAPAPATTPELLSDAELELALRDPGRSPVPPGMDLPLRTGGHLPGHDAAQPVMAQPPRPPWPKPLHPKRKRRRRWPWVLAGALVVFAAVGIGVLAWAVHGSADKKAEAAKAAAEKEKADAATAARQKQKPGDVKPVEQEEKPGDAKPPEQEEKPGDAKPPEQKEKPGDAAPTGKRERAGGEKPPEQQKPVVICPSDDLPDYVAGSIRGQFQRPRKIVSGDWSGTTSLEFIGGEAAFGDATRCETHRQNGAPSAWVCVLVRTALGGKKREYPIAKFTAGKDGLSFAWLSVELPGTMQPDQLRNCLLRFVKGGQDGIVQLRRSTPIEPIQIRFVKSRERTPAEIRWLPKEAALEMSLDIDAATSRKVAVEQRLPSTSCSAIIDERLKIVVAWDRSNRCIEVACLVPRDKEFGNQLSLDRIEKVIARWDAEGSKNAKNLDGAQRLREGPEKQQRIKQLQAEQERIASRTKELNGLRDLCNEIKEAFRLRLRIVMTVRRSNAEEYHVVLAETTPADK
jgi:hypothetical protein